MTGRVDLVWRIFEKIAKNVKVEITVPKKANSLNIFGKVNKKRRFSGHVTSFSTVLHF